MKEDHIDPRPQPQGKPFSKSAAIMFKFLFILFVFKLYARINIYKT